MTSCMKLCGNHIWAYCKEKNLVLINIQPELDKNSPKKGVLGLLSTKAMSQNSFFLFCSVFHHSFTTRKQLSKKIKINGILKITLHSTRHTFCPFSISTVSDKENNKLSLHFLLDFKILLFFPSRFRK